MAAIAGRSTTSSHSIVGLRYEYYPLMTRADRGIEQVDVETLNSIEALRGRGVHAG